MYRRLAVAGLGALGTGVAFVSHKYRPRRNNDLEFFEKHLGIPPEPSSWIEKGLYDLGSRIMIASTSVTLYCYMRLTQDHKVYGQDKLRKYILDRKDKAMVSFANHHSCIDDPFLSTLIMPVETWVDNHKSMWHFCTEEQCFPNEAMGTYVGLGKVVPILRGASIYQGPVEMMRRKIQGGEWVHAFPEARTWQEGGIPLRNEQGRWCHWNGRCTQPGSRLGPFKWGLARAMSESDTEALLVPIYHQGMDKVLPQNSNNDVMHLFPTPGSTIDIAIGDPVPYTDLIRGYEQRRDARSMQRMLARIEQIEASQGSNVSPSSSLSPAPEDTGKEPTGTDAADIDAAKIRCPAAGAYAPPGSIKSSTVGYDGLDSIAPTYLEDEPRGTVVPPEEFEHLKSAQLDGRRLMRYPGRTLPSGRNVPPYVAAESRLLPVDDEDLSEAERKGEHYARLRLYAGITNRMEAAMRQLELQVAAKRKERGVEETPLR